MKRKLRLGVFSSADTVSGQGVGAAYEEQVGLLQNGASDLFDITINSWSTSLDIQHFHTIDPIFFLRIKNKKSLNVAYCHFLPDTLMDGSIKVPKMFQGTMSRYIINFYEVADKLVVVNPSFIDELERFGIPRERVVYIPNFVSRETFHPLSEEQRNAARAKYGIKPDDFVVLGCGQVQTRKGVKEFVETAEMLPDVKFVWAGGFSFGVITDGYDELKKIMDNPPANVTFTGIVERDDMVNIYNMTDVLFVPSYNELFPMTILEAVNLYKPLVIRDLDLYRDILFDDYLKADDNEGFAALIRKLKDDPDFYQEWSEHARNLSEYYSRENVLNMWRKFYLDSYKEKFPDADLESDHETV